MDATINMVHALLEQGRDLWEQDRYEEANRVLTRLLSFRSIPPRVAERAQFYLGDIRLAEGYYAKARRHLAAAIAANGGNSDTHFLMACALDWDDEPNPRRAYRHYRRAVHLEPGQPLYSSAYALMRIRLRGNKKRTVDRDALRRLRNAFVAEPDDPDIVYNYVSGLMEMGRDPEAEIALRRARKQWVNHPAFEQLWHDYLVGRGDLRPSPQQAKARSVSAENTGCPVILKFPGLEKQPVRKKEIRPRARLKTALGSLDDHRVSELARTLRVPVLKDSDAQRLAIGRSLKDGRTVQTLVAGLSAGGRQLMVRIIEAGGSTEIRQIRLRVDGPERSRPHFSRPHRARALDELQRSGLVYLATEKAGQSNPDLIMIPSDLCKLVREAITAGS